MQHTLIFLLLFSFSMLSANTQTTHIAKLNLDSHSGDIQSRCLLLTSDKQKIITRTGKHIDIWNAKDLKHLGRIQNTKHGWSCELYKDDRYFLVQDLNWVALYDLKTMKHIKDFTQPDKKHSDAIVSASFSKDGKSIYTYELITVEPRLRKPFLFRYNIASGKRERIKAFPAQMNSTELKNETLYISDNPASLTVYDIKNDKSMAGTKKDQAIFNSLYTWGDCNDKMSETKLCQIDNGVKYTLASGDLVRSELNASKKTEPKLTFIQRKPLRKAYYYETGIKYPYLINKSTQQYYGWDISKGVQIWSIRQKLTISTEFDSVPTEGMAFFTHQDRAIVIAGFEGEVLDMNISNGIFKYIPKYKNRGSYNSIKLSQDNNTLLLWLSTQIPPLDEYKFTYHTKSGKLLPKHPKGTFISNKRKESENGNRYVFGGNNYFELHKKSDHTKLGTFSLFEKGEWLVTTPQGYFNASSFNVLVNILKKKKQKTTLSNMQDYAKKWYRPDIVEAVLSEKEYASLENKASNFTLQTQTVDNNMFKESLKEMIRADKRLDLLKRFKRNLEKEDIPFLQKGIETANDKETYEAYYRTLVYYSFRRAHLKPFIESRIKTLNTHPLEQAPLLKYIYSKRGPRKKKVYIAQIVQQTTLADDTKLVIAKRAKGDSFKILESLLWEMWEKQFYVSKKVKHYLRTSDRPRAKKAEKAANTYHEKKAIEEIPKDYESLLKTKKYSRERSVIQNELAQNYKILNELNATADLSKQKEIAMKNLDAFFKETEFNPYTVTPYLTFMMKYGSKMEKKILHVKTEIYILSFHDKSKKHNTFALSTFLIEYFTYQPDFVLKTMVTLSKSPIRDVRSRVAYFMRTLKDPKFIEPLLNLLDYKDTMVSNSALATLLNYDEPVIKQVIKKLNLLDSCSKIMYLDITNSQIAKKVDKATYATYRCGN